jgi:hypothetical protein
VLALGKWQQVCAKKQEKRKKKWQQTPLVSSSGCFFDILTAGLRNHRTSSEEPLVSVISQAQRNLQCFLEEPTKNCRFLGT